MGILEAFLITVVTAATPLLIAALGELVVERSGVLNLGVEGMMVMGAVCGFGGAFLTGSPLVGVLAAIAAGMVMAGLFGVLTVFLATNQVATGLALTLLGIGLSGLIGEPFVGKPGQALDKIEIPLLSDIPFVGPILFNQDPLVYLGFALVAGVAYFLFRTRAGLMLRACGDNPDSAHMLGFGVLKVRFLAVLFGGACAGLAGGYLSIAYTPLWAEGMTAGRGWIALALVVFATWLPLRVLVGAYLFGLMTILGFHAQALGVGVPSQFLSALPYLATIVVLVIISRAKSLVAAHTPAAIGRPFVPTH
jgi:general nucleoside transport system permease protein